MAILDGLFAAVLLVSVGVGAWRGLVYEVLSVINWVAALALAQYVAPQLAPLLPIGGAGASGVGSYAAAFVLLFVASMLLGGLVAAGVRKLTQAVGLRPVDRALGALFGLLRGLLLLLLVGVLVRLTPVRDHPVWRESLGAEWVTAILARLMPVLPREWSRPLALV